MSSYRRTSVFINKNNNSNVGSISSFKAGRSSRLLLSNIEFEENELNVQPKIDPRFMIIEENPGPPSPKKPLAPVTTKIENWLDEAEKLHFHHRRATVSGGTTPAERRNFQNLKRNHLTKSASRTSKLRAISNSRPCVSNHEVSSTNEEFYTPRRRKALPKEKLRKLHTSLPGSNQRTIDVHFDGCTNDSDECCLHRECAKPQHDCNVVNLCCKQKEEPPNKLVVTNNIAQNHNEIDPVVGDGRLNQSQKFDEHLNAARMNQQIVNCCCANRKAGGMRPIYKLIFPIVIFAIITVTMLSMHYKSGAVYQLWKIFGLWLETYALMGLRKPLTKWEMCVLFVNKCSEKILGVIMSPLR